MKKLSLLIVVTIALLAGCVYYNTFFIAKQSFNEAEKERERLGLEILKGTNSNYQKAIEKSSVVLEFHPNSKYVDDALFVIGKSFYHQGEFSKAETKFRELLATHPKSEYAERSMFYLGKARFYREDWVGAREAFSRMDTVAHDKNLRSEALFMLGEVLYAQDEYEQAIAAYQDYLQAFAKGPKAAETMYKIAEAYFLSKNYSPAKDAYLGVVPLTSVDSIRYRARYRAGECYYEFGAVDSGLAIYRSLAKDDKNFNQLADIYLQIGHGEEIADSIDAAMTTYEKVVEEYPKTVASAIAFYRLGRIHQEKLLDLETAKAMYDSSTTARANSPVSKDAVARSADIAKLDSYREGMSADKVEQAVESQYLLAELYLTDLNQPDSALNEYQTLLDSFPETKYAPGSLMAIAWIKENVQGDTAGAQEQYRRLLFEYPTSDLVPEALAKLDVDSDMADYDYPARRYAEAEQLLLATGDYEAANEVFQSIVDDFPESEYAAKAQFAIAWSLQQRLDISDPIVGDSGKITVDSTYILAFQKVVDLYGDTEYGSAAKSLLGDRTQQTKRLAPDEQSDTTQDTTIARETPDSLAYLDSVTRAIEEQIRDLPPAPKSPTAVGVFNYPLSAYGDPWEGEIIFRVVIDFTGRVTEWETLRGSGVEDIDIAAVETLKDTTFNPADIDPVNYGKWFVYKFVVRVPEQLRSNLNK
jgi:TonB family protein